MFNSPTPAARQSRRLHRGLAVGAVGLAVAAASTMFAASVSAAPAATNRAPIGHLDSAVLHGASVTLTGWAGDLDTPHNSIDVRAVFTPDPGTPGSPATTTRIAHDPRPDVATAYPALGPNHGFSFTVDSYQAIKTTVCLYGLDLHGGPDGKLGCQSITFTPDHPAIGHLDSVQSVGNNHIEIRGWAADQDTPSQAVSINLLLGGPVGKYYNNVPGKAALARPDIALAYPNLGANHGFDVTVAAKPGTYPVCALAFDTMINHYGGSKLGCITVTV
jgi:hypothetical protein